MKEVNELKTGMQNTTKEYETHKQDVLGHFLAEAGNKVDMLGSYESYFKRGCVFSMDIWPAFRMGQYRVNDHPYHAPQFTLEFILLMIRI